MQLFTERIRNEFFAELLLTLSNLSGIQNFFHTIIPAYKYAKGSKYEYCNKMAK